MITVVLSFFEGKIGTGLFLLASVLSFISVYYLFVGKMSGPFKYLKFATAAGVLLITDAVWLANRYLDIRYSSCYTITEKLIVDFSAAGVLFFVAVAFVNLFTPSKRKNIKIFLLIILALSSAWGFANKLLYSARKEPFCIPGTGEAGTFLVLSFVVVFCILMMGYLSVKSGALPLAQKYLAAGLAIIVVVMGIIVILLTVRDMGVFEKLDFRPGFVFRYLPSSENISTKGMFS